MNRMKQTHTPGPFPGPWHLGESSPDVNAQATIRDAHGWDVAHCFGARAEANARLGEGVTHTIDGTGKLCGPGWLHYYSDPLLAVLLNPTHAGFANPRLWEAEAGPVQKHDMGLKSGTTQLTTLREIPLPAVTLEHRIRFAIRCVMAVPHSERWETWARGWIAGTDRTKAAAAADAAAWAAAARTAAAVRAAAAATAAAAAAAAATEAEAALPLVEFAAWAISGEALPD